MGSFGEAARSLEIGFGECVGSGSYREEKGRNTTGSNTNQCCCTDSDYRYLMLQVRCQCDMTSGDMKFQNVRNNGYHNARVAI
jgi:hypothetical protein